MSFIIDHPVGEVDAPHPSCGARCGRITLHSGKTIETPALLLHTKHGSLPHLMADISDRLGPDGVLNVNALHVMNQVDVLKGYPKGGRSFIGIEESRPIVVTPRDGTAYEYIGALRNATDEGVSVVTMAGAQTLTPETYMTIAGAVGADVIVSLGDEVVADSKTSRVKTSCTRTIEWLKICLACRLETGCGKSLMLGSVMGGMYQESRAKFIEGMAGYLDQLDGICIAGFGTGESRQDRIDIMQTVLEKIPDTKIRMVSSLSSLAELLQAVSMGLDVVDSSYIHDVTHGGYALNFPFNPPGFDSKHSHIEDMKEECASGTDGTKMNLWSETYKQDARPMVLECSCDSCLSHTRSYIHHLLTTHEMTAHVLLEQHNVHHMLQFFAHIRQVIRDGRMTEFLDAWSCHQRLWMTKDA